MFSSPKESERKTLTAKYIYHPNFSYNAERCPMADISPKHIHSHVISSTLINPLLIYFPSFECKFFFERSEVYVAVVCCVVISQPRY